METGLDWGVSHTCAHEIPLDCGALRVLQHLNDRRSWGHEGYPELAAGGTAFMAAGTKGADLSGQCQTYQIFHPQMLIVLLDCDCWASLLGSTTFGRSVCHYRFGALLMRNDLL